MSKPNQADLSVLQNLLEVGTIAPLISQGYFLREIPEAIRHLELRHLEQRQVVAKVAIRI